jgi:hypothetical protein
MRKSPTFVECVGSGLLYGCVSSLITFSNKALAASFDYHFPIFVLFLQVSRFRFFSLFLSGLKCYTQMAATQFILLSLDRARYLTYPRLSTSSIVSHAPIAILYSSNAALALASLQRISIPTWEALSRALKSVFGSMCQSDESHLYSKSTPQTNSTDSVS